ncbi:SDR family oxidoreductase [Rugamonas sp.]|uniref:SDR family NAD(P)-dependent oxidoreductase n=1 Tax=Rugamonas sp. TaxID=1926287 RepID=UPI0025F5C37D|nr:SDR family NAD(P)-dependent oxidoreductase [Rugamonas sp.]
MSNATPLGTAVVTGATGGMGAAYALGLAQRGYDLLLVARNAPALQALAQDIGGATGRKVEVAVHDLADAGEQDRLADRLAADADLALLANIAGMAKFSPFTTIEPSKVDHTIAVNIGAFTKLSRAVAPGFAERGRGAIVNFASILAFRTWPEFNVYSATKAYVLALSQAMQAELQDRGVLVQVVFPPATATPFWQEAGFSYDNLPPKAVMRAEDLVAAALVGLDRREAIVMPSLSDALLWDAYQEARMNLLKGMMSGTVAQRYAGA